MLMLATKATIADTGIGRVEDGLICGQDVGQMGDYVVKIVWLVRHSHLTHKIDAVGRHTLRHHDENRRSPRLSCSLSYLPEASVPQDLL